MFLYECEISVSTNLSGLGSSCLSEFLFRLAKISTAYPGLLIISERLCHLKSLNSGDMAGLGIRR